MKSEDYKRKVDTRDELLTRSLDPAARTNIRERSTQMKNAIFAHELQSALGLTVTFSNLYCEL